MDPRYDGRCRGLGPEDRARLDGEGRPFAVRLRIPDGEAAWDDVTRGRVAFAHADLDDFVIVKSDGLPTYNFGAVVDDAAMRISHVIRGDDHISNTPRQIVLYRSLGLPAPLFAHVPMILGPDGARLSKRHGATSVEMFRDEGFLPEAMVNFLALLGWSYDGKQEIFDRGDLVSKFDLERVGRNAAIFNYEKLVWMNGVYMRALSPAERLEAALAEIRKAGFWDPSRPTGFYERLVEAVGERMRLPRDIIEHGRFALSERLECEPEARAFLEARPEAAATLRILAARLEGTDPLTAAGAEGAVRSLAAELGLKAADLIHPARVALTGRRASIGIFDVMEILGRERTLSRLLAAARGLDGGV
jgi:glutamyl-tRNA synthetase